MPTYGQNTKILLSKGNVIFFGIFIHALPLLRAERKEERFTQRVVWAMASSVARVGGYVPRRPVDQNAQKHITFLVFLRLFFAPE